MIKEVSDQNFQAEVLNVKDKAVLVDFWAPWCGPCQMMAPVLEQIDSKFSDKIQVAKLNTDENQNTAMKYQITGIPCMIVFKDGKEATRLVGYRPPEVLEQDLRPYM